MSQYRYIRCATPGCDSKFGLYGTESDEHFLSVAHSNGWTDKPPTCPDCNAPATTDGPGDDRMLVVPLPCGAFTAYAPVSMTPDDWRVVQGICGAMAGNVADPAVTKDDVIHRLRSIDGMSASNASNYIKRGGLVDAGDGMFTAASVEALLNRIQPKMARRKRYPANFAYQVRDEGTPTQPPSEDA